jgi:uncharacterized membrane protein YebE (DUF533 family)
MLNPEDLLSGLLRGAMSGRRKSWKKAGRAVRGGGIVNARTMLAAAGVAWGLYETWQQQQAARAGGAPGSPTPSPSPAPGPAPAGPPRATPPPLPGSAAEAAPDDAALPPAILQLLRLMISAARADGEIGPQERERVLFEAREVGAEEVVARELEQRRPLAEIVAGVSDPQLAEQLYALAFAIVRADEQVSGGERIYLAQLAHRLSLDAAAVARIEVDASARIDAAND